MAYETGTANSPGDLLVKLFDFAQLQGWTVDQDITSDAQDPAHGAIHKNNVYVSFIFFTNMIKMYPARGFTGGGTFPGEHPESAYSDTSTSTNTGMRINELVGPFSAYHFFEDDNYIHIVVALSNGSYRHFGFGEMIKFGDWDGGEYFYSHFWSQSSSFIDTPNSTAHNAALTTRPQVSVGTYARPHFYAKKNDGTAMPGARANDAFWFGCQNSKNIVNQTDGDGRLVNTGYIFGGDGGFSAPVLPIGRSRFNGFVGMTPIHFLNCDLTPSPDNMYLLGSAPDVRGVNIDATQGSNEYVIGSDTWLVFPMTRSTGSSTSNEEYSADLGFAYKKVTT